ncbi:hypothetical protein BH23GEM6_BH23GEM6_24240 [soil metagenome]
MRKLLIFVLTTLLPLAACGDGGPTDPTQSAVGTYTLVQVNGALPALLEQFPEGRVDVVSGTLRLRGDRTYTETVNLQFTPSTGVVQTFPATENGTFTVTGSTVQFQTSDGDTYSGTLSGNTLSYNVDGFSATYQKQ